MVDVIVVGAGMGGLSAAAVLAKHGKRVLVLEANYLPGGCCSSYWRKGWVFETGATTLMGFDAGQPLALLADALDADWQELNLPFQVLDPAMAIHVADGTSAQTFLRWRDREKWLAEAIRVFGQAEAQRTFWRRIWSLSDFVWRASGRNRHFPPAGLGDWLRTLAANPPTDVPNLRWAFVSVQSYLKRLGLDQNESFRRFLDAQLLITAQNTTTKTPLLFAAPALAYTHYTNVNPKGGMIRLPWALMQYIGARGGDLRLRRRVTRIERDGDHWAVTDHTGQTYQARQVLSNIPMWDLHKLSAGIRTGGVDTPEAVQAWGAFTLGLVHPDVWTEDHVLHHQVILPAGQSLPHGCGSSIFISFSAAGDTDRAPAGQRVLAISTHAADPAQWHTLPPEEYERRKGAVEAAILQHLSAYLPGFDQTKLIYRTASSPRSWQQWTYRGAGSVGGIPQDVNRPLWQWLGSRSNRPGLYVCGDTVYPGQGVPGVVLGGLLAASHMLTDAR